MNRRQALVLVLAFAIGLPLVGRAVADEPAAKTVRVTVSVPGMT